MSAVMTNSASKPRTLAEKVWDDHVVVRGDANDPDLIFIDLHLVHEVTSPQAFEGLRLAGRPVHRPDLTINWFNALTISKKLFVTSDFYILRGIKAKNFQTGEVTKMPVIADLNFKIDYLLTRNFSAFVQLNNVLGKQYQRYQYYPQQGLNFIGGLSFSF